ncbi:hypothetical protein ACFOWB_11295 [Chenggangzhangella methanolivorans]|uniref:hypothetical protein n=1 Tax=Chenggangzhangella methanolivorans TaxID=1437009 RepID=UPI003612CDD0
MFRLIAVAFATMLLACAPRAASAQDAAIGEPDLSPGEVAAAKAACASQTPGRPASGSIKRYVETFVAAHTEYDPKTCKPHGAGEWLPIDKQPCDLGAGCGMMSTGVLQNRPLASGACAGRTYNFASLCYTWILHSNLYLRDRIAAMYVPPQISPVTETFELKVKLVKPTSEASEFTRWFEDGLGLWQQKLAAAADKDLKWSGTSVKETSPRPEKKTNDTCWCAGSTILPFYEISGGEWTVDEDTGEWGPDGVGWNTDAIDYYREKRRAPCGTRFRQQMQFMVVDTHPDWENYGKMNVLGGSFDNRTMTSLRAGLSKTREYKVVAKKARLACSKIRFPDLPPAGPGAMAVIDDPRPVAAAAMEIERVSGRAISYEDAPFRDRRAMASMVEAAEGDAFLAPRGDVLTTPMPSSPDQAAAALRAAVVRYEAGRPVAAFDVIEDGMIRVAPRAAVDASGAMRPVTPALDRRISLKAKPRTGMELLGDLREAVAAAEGRRVLIGTVPTGLLSRLKVGFGAADEPARAALARLVAASGRKMAWKLLYDPGFDDYALNLTVVD